MGGGGKAVFKRAASRKKDYGDDDEEYVAEEDESSYESSSANEESLDASDAYDSSSSASTEEEISNAKVKCQRGHSSNHRRTGDSDYDEWNDDDEDFSPDDWEEDSFVLGDIGSSARKGATKRGGTKRKRRVSKPKSSKRSRKVAPATGKRKRPRTEASSEDEDNFTENGRKSHIKYPKKVSKRMAKSMPSKKKKLSIDADLFDPDYSTSDDDLSLKVHVVVKNPRNKMKGNSRRRKKTSKVDSETSDSDFVVSDEDLFDNDFVELANPRKNSREVRKIARTSRKQLSVESKRTDYADISEDEVNDLEIDRNMNMLKYQGVSVGKKGKVKEADDSGKQLCGICLSEEHRGTIQGILNCCSHYFCFACIMEWSKVESRCPLCKRRFVTITKTLRPDSTLEMRRHVIRVQKRDQVYQPSEEELRVLLDPYENVVCMECHLGGDDNLMLLCDICDSSAHTYCVGLGKEVPEGNWYCDCCKLAGEGSLLSQVLDTHGASSSLMCHSDVEEKASNPQNSSILQRSISLQGQPSSLGPDLNAPPINFMESTAVSVPSASGTGASTLYSRRAIRRRIRVFMSNARLRQPHSEPIRADIDSQTEAVHSSELEQNGVQIHPLERPNSMYSILSSERQIGNSRDFPHSDSNLVQHTSNGEKNFQQVDGAEKTVRSMVKRYLKKLPKAISLDRSTFKKIAKKATHTILDSFRIRHSGSAVSTLHEPPNKCSHELYGEKLNLVTGYCHPCLHVYVKHVVKMLVETL